MKSKIVEFINLNKKGLSVLLFFFLLLVIFLFLTNSHPRFHVYAIIISFLIFIIYQYFKIDYRIFLSFALILLLFCPFLLIFKEGHYQKNLAEYFASYACGFIVLGVIGYFFDNLKNRIRTKRIFKIFIFVIIGTTILLSIFILYKDYKNNESYIVAVESFYKKSIVSTKNIFLKAFNKKIYYSKSDEVILDNQTLKEDILILVSEPKDGSIVYGNVRIKGAAIEKNSIENTGIDKVEFYLDGKPGKGKYLGNFNFINIIGDKTTTMFIKNIFINTLYRLPNSLELNYWTANLEWKIISYREFISLLIDSREFKEFKSRRVSNETFVTGVYKSALNRYPDTEGLYYWVNLLETGEIDRNMFLNIIMVTDEFKKIEEKYYNEVKVQSDNLSVLRKNMGDEYGKQFYLSGFDVYLDSTKVENGKHKVYIYAHSPLFGWDYETLSFEIKN